MSYIRKINAGQPDWNRFDRVASVSYFRIGIACVGLLLLALSANAEDFVSPGVNTNLIAVTPGDNVPDYSHKQQQEPSCIVRPSNSAYIMCAFNDLRASDDANVQGDSWIGFSMSGDIGKTFRSGLVPGYKGHPNSLNMGFAADASLMAIPGADPGQVGGNATKQSPGLAILNYIGGYRDSSVGVLAIQRFVENEQEDQLPWLPEDEIYIIADGTSGRFIDKPAFLYVPDDAGAQRTTTESIVVEGLTDPVTVSTPTGTLIVAYAVFTGSSSIKVMTRESKNNGRTWNNATKLSESQNEVTGVTLTAIGQGVVASWRQRADGNNGDAIMSAYSSNAGKRWTKGEVMFDLCPFDQPATGVTFRTFAFPWAANDGKRFWTFATDRRYKTEGGDITSCDVTPGAPPSIYEGVPRIVGMSSADGVNWVGASGSEPFVLDSNLLGGQPGGKPIGMQVMPSAFGTKGRIDIAWYDTRRETEERLPGNNPVPLINDYWGVEANAEGDITSLAMVVRKADVWMTRLSANCGTGGGCSPIIETPVRVSRYPVAFFDDAGVTKAYEIESHLPNHKLYASGTLAFKGDYISVASPALRKNAEGQWIPNHAACGADEIDCTDREDIFVAWGDNRDVRVDYNYLSQFSDGEQVPFTPPPTQTTSLGFKLGEKKSGASEPLVDVKPEMAAVTESDDSTDPSVPQDDILTCSATTNFGRSRDANVYGAVIADAPSLVAPTSRKPLALSSIQRTFPLVLNNPDLTKAKNFCLQIANQPAGFPSAARASFLQLPSSPDANVPPLANLPVSVPPGSSASRALYVVAPAGSVVRIKAFEDDVDGQAQACLELNDPNNNSTYTGTLQDVIAISDGNLFDSEYCSLPENAVLPACIPPVAGTGADETHNIRLALANLQSPVLKAPVTALNLQAPPLEALNFQNLNFQNLNFQNLNLQNLNFQNLNFQNLNFQNLNLQNLNFQNLNFQNLNFQNAAVPDFTNLNLQNLNFQNLNLQNLNFQNLNFQNLNFQNLNFQNLNFQNLNLQNLNFQNLNLQAPALSGGDEGDTGEEQILQAVNGNGDVWYQDITYIVETDANVSTTYTSDIALDLDTLKDSAGDPDEAVVQLIAWTPNEYNDGIDDCGSAVRFEAQVISAVTLKSSNLADVNLPTTFAPTNQNPYEGEVSFTSKPGQPVALTVRIWATGMAKTKLQGLYADWEDCANNDVSMCENEGIGGLISFGASAQSCRTSDTNNLDGVTDCLDNGNEKIFQDRTPPSLDPITPPDGFTPDDLPYELGATQSELEVTWPITGTDADAESVNFECAIGGTGPYYPDIIDVDPVAGTFTATFSYPFPAGTTPVSCTATDGNGNTSTATFEVTVDDVTGPVLGALPNPNAGGDIGATGSGGALVSWGAVSAIDAVDGPTTASCVSDPGGLTSGDVFPIGDTPVICTAIDAAGNQSEGSFTVTVVDSTPPTIDVPTDFSVNAGPDGTASPDLETGVTPVDNVGIATFSCTADPYPLVIGNNLISCTATDNAGLSTTQTYTITVVDATPPSITVPTNFSVNAGPDGTASPDLETGVTPVDNVGIATFSCTADPYPLVIGNNLISCTATDNAGLSTTQTYTITVVDATPPTIAVPTGVSVSTDASGTATLTPTELLVGVTADDNVGVISLICTAVINPLPVGLNTVTCIATDGAGLSATKSYSITVLDATAPIVTAPDRTIERDYANMSFPFWGEIDATELAREVTVTDGGIDITASANVSCMRDVPPEQIPANPMQPPILTNDDFAFSDEAYSITCTAEDSVPNLGTASYSLTVRYLYDIDLIPPKGRARAGSTVPLDWQYSDLNGLIDSSGIDVAVSWQSMIDSSCVDPQPGATVGISSVIDTDSGNSDFRYSHSNDTWQFSWQTPGVSGWHKVAILPPGGGVKDAWECINLR